MPLLFRYSDERYRLGVWKIAETEEQLLALLSCHLDYVREVEHFGSESRRKEWLAVRALLHAMEGIDKTIGYLPSGKPFLSCGKVVPLSISHTKGYAAVIIGNDNVKEVGIDIEIYGTRVRRIISRFMRPDEEIRLWHNDDLWALLLHWSAKETIYKCMNMEGVDFCEHLRVVPFSPEPQGHFEACEYLTPDKQVYRIDYLLHPEFVLTWTSV